MLTQRCVFLESGNIFQLVTCLYPLRRRNVEDNTKHVQANNELVISDDLLGTISFVHQADDVLSGQHNSFDMNNFCAVRFNHAVQMD